MESRDVIIRVGEFIRREKGKVTSGEIETKSLNSLVSYVDKTAEEHLVKNLGSLLPEAVFLTEEETVKTEAGDLQWIIDPLDGTTNFLHQIPVFSISVALQWKGETIMGIVYEVNQDECFYAWKSGGAYLNSKPISVRKSETLADALIATGFPYYDYDKVPGYLKILEAMMRKTRGIRRLGSAAVDLAYVACGRFDAFFEYSLNPWDVAAGAFIVQEAGGKVTDFKGGNDYLHGREIVATSAAVEQEFFGYIKDAFGV
jgi:myo-inositol-1(or 4)-monophosphatase